MIETGVMTPQTGLSRGQLRHPRPITGDDVNLGVPLFGAFFRVGGRRSSEFVAHARRLLFYLTLTSGILSALLVKDTICLRF
jgi:hypothetical protein